MLVVGRATGRYACSETRELQQKSGDRRERHREPSLAVDDPIAISTGVQQEPSVLLELADGEDGFGPHGGSNAIAPSDATELRSLLEVRVEARGASNPAERHEAE